MIYDCLMFNDEVDLLDIRLRHHAPFVDHTIVIESAYTYSGQPKPLLARQCATLTDALNAGRATLFQMEQRPDLRHPAGWAFEHLQRDLLRGYSFESDDILLYCDCDEILRDGSVIERFARSGKPIQSLQMDLYFYYLNCRLKRGDVPGANYHVAPCFRSKWHMGKLLRASQLSRVRHLYELREHELWANRPDMIEGAGWHYSNLGTPERIARKCQAISHWQDAEFRDVTEQSIVARRAGLADLCGRPGVEFEIVPDKEVVPEALEERYRGYFYRA